MAPIHSVRDGHKSQCICMFEDNQPPASLYRLNVTKWRRRPPVVGLNGKFFELYATLPASIPPKTGTALCARLVKSLMGDERILFLSNPITWGS